MASFDIGGAIRGALEGVEEDSAPVDVTEGSRRRGSDGEKIPLENAGNLIKVREAREKLLAGDSSAELFCEAVGQVLKTMMELLSLYELPQVQAQLEQADEAQRAVAEKCRVDLETIAEGLEQMMDGADTGDQTLLDTGFARVEAGYQALDATQDAANEIADDYEDEE